MAEKETVGVRLPADTLGRVEQYADEHDLSKSDALRRMIQKGLDLEEAGLTVAASSRPSRSNEEKEAVADGGLLRLSDHPWIDPIINFCYYLSLIAGVLTTAAFIASLLPVSLIGTAGAVILVTLIVLGVVVLGIDIVGILILEVLMHPSEAPIRRYFYGQEEETEVVAQ